MLDQNIRLWHQLGYDAIRQSGLRTGIDQNTRLESEDTALLRRDRRRWVNEATGAISSWADFDRYPWSKAEEVDWYPMEYVAKHLPEGMGIIAASSGILEPVMHLMGYETFALALHTEPDLVQAIFDKVAERVVARAQEMVQMDRVIAVWMGDDMGYKTATMIAPRHLRQYVFPVQKQVSAIAHNQGLPFLLHSCGNLEVVMEDLIDDVEIDAKHSFEDAIEPVESFARRYGERIAVIGGVDVDVLSRGTEEQVRTRTREILEACAPTRSYILGSGNSVTNYVLPRNFLAMIDEGHLHNARQRRG
jgi:uroporphyrinogen decarboxylase